MRIIFAILLLPVFAMAASVESCHDGDTCRFNDGGKTVKVRFWGIDAPEEKQTGGTRAGDFLRSYLRDKKIRIEYVGHKSYKREVARVYANDEDVSRVMVENGWAWDYPQYSHGKYASAMQAAKAKKIGIWGNPTIISPFCFRKKNVARCESSHNQYQP